MGEDNAVTNEKIPTETPAYLKHSLRAKEGDVIVGIIMGFGHESGVWDHGSEHRWLHEQMGPWTKDIHDSRQKASYHTAISYVGALTMPWISSEED